MSTFIKIQLLLYIVFFNYTGLGAQEVNIPLRPGHSKVIFNDKPFWREKKNVYRRIQKERAIIVSVKVEPPKSAEGKKKLIILGGGIINLPYNEVFPEAKNLQNIYKMSTYVIKSDWNKDENKFFMHSKAFGYHAKMWMNVSFNESSDYGDIRWKIVKGTFANMEGVIRFVPLKNGSTEIGIQAEYEHDKLPVPEFFVEFGLEVAMQKMAARMRGYFENKLKSEKSNEQKK